LNFPDFSKHFFPLIFPEFPDLVATLDKSWKKDYPQEIHKKYTSFIECKVNNFLFLDYIAYRTTLLYTLNTISFIC